MFQEKGIVKEILGKTANVFVKRKESCEGCAASQMCKPSNGGVLVHVSNPVDAKVGNEVLLIISSEKILGASALIYVVPVLGLMLGMLIGHFIPSNKFSSDEMSFFCGILGLFITIFSLWIYNHRLGKEYSVMPTITKIL